MVSNRERGQAIVELVLVTTVMFFLLVGALDLGRVFYAQIAVTDAAKEGALVASQGGTTTDVKTAAVNEAQGGFVSVIAANVTTATCPPRPNASTPPVTTSVAAPFRAITPLVAAILPSDGMVRASAISSCRYTPPLVLASVPPSAPPSAPASAPPSGPPPACPTVDFTAVSSANGGHPHWMDFTGAVTPSTSGWSWAWSGAFTASGQTQTRQDFPASGPVSITLTATKAACSPTITKTVTVP